MSRSWIQGRRKMKLPEKKLKRTSECLTHYHCPAPGLGPLSSPCYRLSSLWSASVIVALCFSCVFRARHQASQCSCLASRWFNTACSSSGTMFFAALQHSAVLQLLANLACLLSLCAVRCRCPASSVSRPLSCCFCFTSPCGVRPHRCSALFSSFSCTRNEGSPFQVWTVLGSKQNVLSAGRFASLHTRSLASFERACRRGSSCFAAAQGMVGAG